MTENGKNLIQCVYCLKEIDKNEVTEDHVIARSWYPANTPEIAKWKVPSCGECNNRYSAIEEKVLNLLALCMDPEDQSVRHIVGRAMRSIDPKKAKSYRDAMHRFNRRQSVLGDLTDIHDPNIRGVLPAFKENFGKGSRTGVMIPAKALHEVVEKWIRGINFCEFGEPIQVNHKVSVQFVEDGDAEIAFSKIMKFAKRVEKGPGVEVLIWHAVEKGESITQYAFNIWQKFRVYGSIESPGLLS